MNAHTYTGTTGRNVSLFFLLLGLGMTVLPFAINADIMAWGGACAFIGLFVFITSLILVPFFAKRAAIMRKIRSGDGILAWWRYPADAWEKERQEQISDLSGMKIGGFVIGGIFALIGIIVFATDPDDLAGFLVIMLGVCALMIVVSQLSVRATKKRLLHTEDEAVIHTDGLFYRGELTSWGNGMNRLKAVGWNLRNPSQLLFCYRQFRRHGDGRVVAVIPIPPGQEPISANVVGWFNRPLNQEWQQYFDRTASEENENPDSADS